MASEVDTTPQNITGNKHRKADMTQKPKPAKLQNWVALPTGTDIFLFFTNGWGLHVFYSNGTDGSFLLDEKPRNEADLLFQVSPWSEMQGNIPQVFCVYL